ncbi:ubiquitin-like protein Pup [Luteococcus sp. Sow4_B9]|uniref:ubiquitin-like protein Pup n=1 Tax=Luteococcus sp. Sow4_B9 TaxID=3438792 RepID=UPI003F9675D1
MSVSEQQRINRVRTGQTVDEQAADVEQASSTSSTSDEGFDALLDEIDGVLETNAAEYVRSFVQKGGQ